MGSKQQGGRSGAGVLTVGIDYRPALQNREGIGRYTRELVKALAALPAAPDLRLYGSTLAPPRVPSAPPPGTCMRRWRVPSRLQPWMLAATSGADGFLGGARIFHHTQYNRLPVKRALEVATLHDCIYLLEPQFVGPDAAARMSAQARQLASHARRVLVPSEYVRGRVAEAFQLPAERIHVTPLGCDHLAPVEPGKVGNVGIPARPGPPYVLTVSRIEPRKNHLRMLRAFEGVVGAGLPHRWKVVGPAGHDADVFLDALDRSPARERVDWESEVSEAQLSTHLAAASAFLFTSLSEGFGLPPLEAMARGIPVVASDSTSVGEVCAGGALLVDPLDVDATRDALCELLGDEAVRDAWAIRARERAASFTWERCARATLAAYESAWCDSDQQ
ncbi:MAG: glycosyltransferase involved in cell wall biosynthesis [Chlamydiales bacterium]|jgi:glycosyltransferase involved in cell wall biosynthesis